MHKSQCTHREEIELLSGERLVVRDMEPGDAAWAARLEEQIFSQPWSEHAFWEEIGRQDRLFAVAEVNGTPVAYCGMICVFGEGDITNVAVAQEARRQGIARRMLQTVLEWGRQMGLDEFTLEVRKSNLAAIHLYETLGFVTEGVRRNFYELPTEDAFIMWKRQETVGTITTEK